MVKILLTRELDEVTEARLAAAGDIVRSYQDDEKTLVELVGDCVAIVARTSSPISRRVIEAASQLRVIGVAGVGVDNVDLEAAREHGVEVVHTPGAATDAVADLTVGLMLNLLRPIGYSAAVYRRGDFKGPRAHPSGSELNKLTVGIVGMGRIGSAVARRLSGGFGSRVLYNDIVEVGPFQFPAHPVDKETIWKECDIVSLHVPLTEETRGLVNADVFEKMQTSALLINTARGAVVDTPALTHALQAREIAGAGLDVVEPEPLTPVHPLFDQDRCILTPHIAARTPGGVQRMFAVVDAVVSKLAQPASRV